MNLVQKKRSERNQTITLSPAERTELKKELITEADISVGFDPSGKIICGDVVRVSEKLPRQSVDLLILDPPYNLDKDFHGVSFKKGSISGYTEYLDSWLPSLIPLLKPGATIYICSDYHSSTSVHLMAEKYFTVRNRITWQREKGRGAKTNWKNSSEDIWFCTLGNGYQFHVDRVKEKRVVIAPYRQDGKPKDWEETPDGNFRLTHPSNFWNDISVPYWSMPENTEHPTQKPEKLFAKMILASSNPGDLVLDPFCGSGTSAVTAKKLGRNYCAYDSSEEYCLLALKRLKMADSDKTIQGYKDGVFWERNSRQLKRSSEDQRAASKLNFFDESENL